MASLTIYPPIVESSMDAFIAGDNSSCRVYFSLSKFNVYSDFDNVQVSIKKQSTGTTIVKNASNVTIDGDTYYTATGIILNVPKHQVSGVENLYYVDIKSGLLEEGWVPGWICCLQLRLSAVAYSESDGTQSSWLNAHGGDFSEWSTVCIVKATGEPTITIPALQYEGNDDMTNPSIVDNLDFIGSYKNVDDPTENLHSYRILLYKASDINNLLEDTGICYPKARNQIEYTSHIEPLNNTNYLIFFMYETINGYQNTILLKPDVRYSVGEVIPFELILAENDGNIYNITAEQEADYGFVGIKVYDPNDTTSSLKFVIRRASSRDNFTTWTDIKRIELNNEKVNERDVICDFTIESGVWYKYGIQTITADGTRGPLKVNALPALREFEYTFLLGADNKQLRVSLNNNADSYKINTSEGITPTINGKFPYTGRYGDTYYKSFNISGLITFNMDEYFATKADVYKYSSIVTLFNEYNNEHDIDKYDFIYEKYFRDAVMNFLYDGKPKLYKSQTEGNMIIKLSGISLSPQQNLNRLVFSFTGTATEMAECNEENLKKYNLLNLESRIGDNIKLTSITNHTNHEEEI